MLFSIDMNTLTGNAQNMEYFSPFVCMAMAYRHPAPA
jgi:hypothetical protein